MPAVSGSMNCFLSAYGQPSTDSLPLWMFGCPLGISGVTGGVYLSMTGEVGETTSSLNLTLVGPERIAVSGVMNLSMEGGVLSTTGFVPLYLCNSGVYGEVSLYISGAGETPGSLPSNSYMNLFLARPEGAIVPLYIRGGPDEQASSGVNLFMAGHGVLSEGVDLYLSGVGTLTGNVKCYTRGF